MNYRSWLCSPATHPGMVDKAISVQADIIHFDLEDSVSPENKQAARIALADQFRHPGNYSSAIRINPLNMRDGLDDLAFLKINNIVPDIIIVPKSCICRDASMVRDILGDVRLFAVIESISTHYELCQMKAPVPGLAGVIFGSADFSVSMNIAPQHFPSEMARLIKMEISLHAHRLGIMAIDAPCFALHDIDRLQMEILQAREFGFKGKIALHPRQVAAINRNFCDSNRDKSLAREIIDKAQQNITGPVFTMSDVMVGPPHLKHAKAIIED